MFTIHELQDGWNRLLSPEDSGEAVEETAGEGTEVAPETTEEAPNSEVAEGVPDLSGIPEEFHATITQYAQHQRGQAESSWTQKFQEQGSTIEELQKQAEIVKQFNERFEKDPQGLINDLKGSVPETSKAPEDPGEMPDPVEDPEAFKGWYAQDRAFTAYQMESRLRQQYGNSDQVIQQIQQERAMTNARTAIGATEEEFAAVLEIRAQLAKDPNAALKYILDNSKGVKAKTAAVREAIKGTEERPGLQRSGARNKIPEPTGDHMTDAQAELAARGIKFQGPEV